MLTRCSAIGQLFALLMVVAAISANETPSLIGYAEEDITPKLDDPESPVWLAGYGVGRRALGVHDPLKVRCVVWQVGQEKLVFGAVDLIGLQIDAVRRIRSQLAGFKQITIASTHNHEGPDVIGIWGKTLFQRGVDEAYIDLVVERTVKAVKAAESKLSPVTVAYGTAEDETLMDDIRLPHIKDGVLRGLRFNEAGTNRPACLLVQWNCHPETLGPKNQQITADFPAYTIAWLQEKYHCPVLYMSGAVGGLMAPPKDRIKNAQGEFLNEGDFEFAKLYGEEVGKLADQAFSKAEPVQIGPPQIATQPIALHVQNKLYRLARQFGVLKREGHEWVGNPFAWGALITEHQPGQAVAVTSEVNYTRLGELHLVLLPCELYPELVYGKHTADTDPAADFPDAEREPTVLSLLPNQKWMLFGLANDEIGYVIPKRQWDEKPPYCYELEKGQYGEINSCGPETAPIVMKALQQCIQRATTVPALSKD